MDSDKYSHNQSLICHLFHIIHLFNAFVFLEIPAASQPRDAECPY